MANRSYHPRRPIADRFWEKVDKNGPIPPHRPELGQCWVWTAACIKSGYGRLADPDAAGKWEEAHRVSWALHHGAPGEQHVLHKCDNRPCVRPDHLFLGDHLANARDREEKGRGADHAGEANGRRVLTVEDVVYIRTSGVGTSILAKKYGLCKSQILRVRNGAAWASVGVTDSGARPTHAEVTPRGSRSGMAKLTEETVAELRRRYALGEPPRKLAADYQVGKTTVHKIVNRETWRHVA